MTTTKDVPTEYVESEESIDKRMRAERGGNRVSILASTSMTAPRCKRCNELLSSKEPHNHIDDENFEPEAETTPDVVAVLSGRRRP